MCRVEGSCHTSSLKKPEILRSLHKAFTPFIQRTESEILKVQNLCLSRIGKDTLLEIVRNGNTI